MRWLLVFAVVVMSARPLCAAVQLADETVRYVNDQVISLGDILRRNGERLLKGNARPPNSEMLQFAKDSLEELTDDELLVQYAKRFAEEHKFRLLDDERITQRIMESGRASGHSLTLQEQAIKRQMIERQESIDFILSFYASKSSGITPADLYREWERRSKEFSRPPRAKVMEILLRSSGPAEREELRQHSLLVFQHAQDATDAAIKQIVAARLNAFLDATAADDKQRLVSEAVKEIAALDGHAGLDPGSAKVVADAKRIMDQSAALRDADQAFNQLVALRQQLTGKDAEAFAKVARASSQGPNASDGGDRGWIEPGSEGQAFDQVVFTLKPNELSPVFRTEQGACLVLVVEREEASTKPFAEAAGEIESGLRVKRDAELRRQVVEMLRRSASIRDVASLDVLSQ